MLATKDYGTERKTRWERDVVVRKLAIPFGDLSIAGLPEMGALRFTGPFRAGSEGAAAMAHAPAILHPRRLVVPTTVEVQVVEWSRRWSELRIVADSRHVGLWGEHRRQRYFDLAHDAADRLALVLERRQVVAA